ncbi:MAG TPA: 50S ribosomal protein L6 [Thermodesulfobacteriota bacterium]|nr:50S ribosomal protein L6 [Thermodesulfobacteriota bacterium]
MSRIGKLPIEIPSGVKASVEATTVHVKGPKGALSLEVRPGIIVEVKGSAIEVKRVDDERLSRGLHGLTRTLIANMVTGVHQGFEKKLEIVGVGYRAEVKGDTINLLLGYSHPIQYKLPEGISAAVEKQTAVTIKGSDKQLVGQVAADIRAMRKPEPYKGKGVKYAGEIIRRKAGKAAKGAGG